MTLKRDDENEKLFDAIAACLDASGEASLEELRRVRRALGHDVETSEQEFLKHLRQLRNNLVHSGASSSSASMTVKGLLERAQAVGIDPIALADQSGLSISLVTKFDRRLIASASTPRKVIEQLALVLKMTVESVSAYLAQPPAFALGASFKAQKTPVLSEPQDFFEAVAADRSISEERRRELMKLKASA